MEKKNSYPELEGTEIKVTKWDEGEMIGIIKGCDYDIGITVVSKEDPDYYIWCLVGPSAPNFTDFRGAIERHKELFELGVEMFLNKHLIVKYIASGMGSNKPSAETCPWGQ